MPSRIARIPPLAIVMALACLESAPAFAAGADGAWSEAIPPDRKGHCAIYDPVRQRMVVAGGDSDDPTGVWTVSLSANPSWSFVPTTGRSTVPPDGIAWSPDTPLTGGAAIYDPVRDRMLIDATDFSVTYGSVDMVWALSLASMTWSKITTAGTPPTEPMHQTAVYDPIRDRMITFGGGTGYTPNNDTWALSLSGTPTWTKLAPAGTLPPARMDHGAIYDPVRDRMVIYGGSPDLVDVPGATDLNDVWALSLSGTPTWTQLTPGGTLPAHGHGIGLVYDSPRDRMLLMGGITNLGASTVGQTWALDFATMQWQKLLSTGAPADGATYVFDPVNQRVMAFGARNGLRSLSLLPTPVWTRFSRASSMGSVYDPALAYDAARSRLLISGGGEPNDFWPFANNPYLSAYGLLDSTARLVDFSIPSSALPPSHIDRSMVVDPSRNRLILFGGYGDYGGGGTHDDLWWLAMTGTLAWTQVPKSGAWPSARGGHSAIYDPAGDRMLMFGGNDGSQCLNQLWQLSLGSLQWQSLTPAGTPPSPRQNAAVVLDPVANRLIFFGGFLGAIQPFRTSVTAYNDLWSLNLSGPPTWTLLAPIGTPPPPRPDPIAIYDPDRTRVEVVTDVGVWALQLGDPPMWQKLDIAHAVIGDIERGVAAYDPIHHHVLAYPGYEGPLWQLDFTGAPTAVEIALVEATAAAGSARIEWQISGGTVAIVSRTSAGGAWVERATLAADARGHVVLEDPDVTPGARYGYRLTLRDDTGAHTGGEAWVSIPALDLALRGAVPNPASGDPSIAFTLADATPARLALFDLAGRAVAVRDVGALGPGPHVVTLSPDRPLAPGIYQARLTVGGRALDRRIAVVR